MSVAAIDGRPNANRRRSRLASTAVLAAGLLPLVLMIVDVPLESSIHTLSAGQALELVLVMPFTLVGTAVALRDRRNPVGWLLIGIPLIVLLSAVGSDYAMFVYYFGHRGSPLGPVAVFFDAMGPLGGLLLLPLVILLFPDGRIGGRWRWPLRLAFLVYVGYFASNACLAAVALQRRVPVWSGGGVIGQHHPTSFASWISVTKPITVSLFVVFCVASIARQVLSYRTSDDVRRRQLKCLGIGGVMTVISVLLAGVSQSAL